MLPEQQFLTKFENTSLDPRYFNHLGHLRIAWIYLKQYPTEQAIKKIAAGINRYATALGAPEKFHMTITIALAQIIASRINKYKALSWEDFVEVNQDLLVDAKQLLANYYSSNLIGRESARVEYLKPDKRDFDNA